MDRERQKRNRMRRLILTEALMVVSVIALVAILMLVVMGYKLDKDGTIEQSGLLQIESIPGRANVSLDGGDDTFRTSASKMVSAGKHTISVSKDGYDSWESEVEVTSGLVSRVNYVQLFKTDRTSENMKRVKNLMFFSPSPDQSAILFAERGSFKWIFAKISNDEFEQHTLDVSDIFDNKDEELTGDFKIESWNSNGNKVLVKRTNNNKSSYFVLNLEKIAESVNLNKEFGLTFSQVRFISDSGDQLYGLEKGNLRKINLNDNEVSRILISNVEEFSHRNSNIIYVGNDKEKGRFIGFYKEGEKESVLVEKVKSGDEKINFALFSYLGDNYLMYSVDKEIKAYYGDKYPSAGSSVKNMKKIELKKLSFVPSVMEVKNNGRFVMIKSGKSMSVFNSETNKTHKVDIDNEDVFWINGFIIADIDGTDLNIRDFNNFNKKTLVRNVAPYNAIINKNHNYLYYVAADNEGLMISREKLL